MYTLFWNTGTNGITGDGLGVSDEGLQVLEGSIGSQVRVRMGFIDPATNTPTAQDLGTSLALLGVVKRLTGDNRYDAAPTLTTAYFTRLAEDAQGNWFYEGFIDLSAPILQKLLGQDYTNRKEMLSITLAGDESNSMHGAAFVLYKSDGSAFGLQFISSSGGFTPAPPAAASTALGTFTADAGTNVLTFAAAHGLAAGDQLRFFATVSLPSGLSNNTTYYVIAGGLTTTACKISATLGGSEIDLTTAGTGTLRAWKLGACAFIGYTADDSGSALAIDLDTAVATYLAGEYISPGAAGNVVTLTAAAYGQRGDHFSYDWNIVIELLVCGMQAQGVADVDSVQLALEFSCDLDGSRQVSPQLVLQVNNSLQAAFATVPPWNGRSTLSAEATLDFGSTGSGAVADLTIAVPGAVVGDVVALGVPNASITATATFSAWVSADDTVTVRFSPKGTENPASGTFKVIVFRS